MSLRLVTPPTGLPLTLTEAKAHLRVETTADDAYISALIAAAVSHIDGPNAYLGRAIMPQTWELKINRFPTWHLGLIRIPLPPLQSVELITYLDSDGSTVTLDASAYIVDTWAEPAVIRPAGSWPSLSYYDEVIVRFVAGYADADSVPMAIKQALLLLIGAWYENREETVIGVSVDRLPRNVGAEALLSPYRLMVA